MSKTWMKEDDVDPFDQAMVRHYLMEIEHDFNKVREQLYYRTQSYYHQSIASNYTKEDDLRELITRCEELKRKYNEFKDQVKLIRGTPYVI